jgi:outer membrane protein assembly factor BamD (BamD/ComL family)
MRFIHGIVAAAAFLCFAGCASGPLVINEDLTPEELIQRAQEASDRNRYKVSLQYYQALLDRFPSNIDWVIAAEYEIAFIHYKQKNYEQSREEFNSLLQYYDTPDAELLPPQFKILAEIVLEQISEKENAPLYRLMQRLKAQTQPDADPQQD